MPVRPSPPRHRWRVASNRHRGASGYVAARPRGSVAILGLAAALVMSACSLFGNSTPNPSPAASTGVSTTSTSASSGPSASEAGASPSTASPAATTKPTPKPTPTPALCPSSHLTARITLWEGAAGHRIAHVRLTNSGSSGCAVRALSRPQLVDGIGVVIINGASPAASAAIAVAPSGSLTTLVEAGNYCRSTPIPPVSVAFVLAGGAGRIVARPVSPSDVAGLPPCLGSPGSTGTIQMQPWAP